MQSIIDEQVERRLLILKGIRQGSNMSDIAAQLGINRSIIKKEIWAMQYQKDSELRLAQATAREQMLDKQRLIESGRSEKFLLMTGMSIQEKTFRNMIEFYRPELTKIIKSEDQYLAISKLPKNVLKTLKHNGIILYSRKNLEIASQAQGFLV